MAALASMPPIMISQADLARFGQTWHMEIPEIKKKAESLSRTPPQSSGDLGKLFDTAVGNALSILLGSIPIIAPSANALIPAQFDCVEVGPVRVIGGVRPQNFDVGYRPDGVRFAYDTKTLNDRESVGKNWQNMVNDLATEATTVHSRFPHTVVAFLVACPIPCVSLAHRRAIIETLERLARRTNVEGPPYMAEVISLVLWNPDDGSIEQVIPAISSPLRIERFSEQVEAAYVSRYKGLPPHTE